LQRYSSTLNVSRHHPDVIQMLRLFDVHECLRDIEVAGETVIAKI
jgi:ribosomal protein L30/L7E